MSDRSLEGVRIKRWAALLASLLIWWPHLSKAQPVLSFTATGTSGTHIYTYDVTTGDLQNFSRTILRPLHSAQAYRNFYSASWSPDGRRVAYRTDDPGIFVADLKEGGATRFTESHDFRYSWAPDSRRLVFARRDAVVDDHDLFVLDIGTGQVKQLTANPNWDSYPCWSPVSNEIAFSSDRNSRHEETNIWVLDVEDPSSARILTAHVDASTKLRPSWSPDGQTLAFDARSEYAPEREARSGIWRIGADGSNPRFFGIDLGFLITTSPAWSPDGSMLAFERVAFSPADSQVGLANADGSAAYWLDLDNLTVLHLPRWVYQRPAQATVESISWAQVKSANEGGPAISVLPSAFTADE